MSPRALALAALLGLPPLAFAQEFAPMSSPASTPPPGVVTPAPPAADPASPTPTAPEGVTATLAAPRSGGGPLALTLTLTSARDTPVAFGVGRDNRQNCALAPTVRVLRVGTREVVYPVPGEEPRLCSQELQGGTLTARGRVTFTRDLDLPAGEYMVEGWFAGFADGVRVKVPAQPVRVTVR